MTINVQNIKYKLEHVDGSGTRRDITQAVMRLNWEENDGEWATRINFTVKPEKVDGKSLSSLMALNSVVFVYADIGQGWVECARGNIYDWQSDHDLSSNETDLVAYDMLFRMAKSQDHRFYAAGTSTRSAIVGIMSDWNIPLGLYNGPDKTHAKQVFQNDTLAQIVQKFLDDAETNGSNKYVIRAREGKVEIVPRGSNAVIYHLEGRENVLSTTTQSEITDMVTRIKILGKADDEGRSAIVSTIDGQTSFGILQKILTSSDDDSLQKATEEANKIIKEDGKPKLSQSMDCADIPTLRKGDKIKVTAGALDGFFYATEVSHKAESRRMRLTVIPVE